MSENFISRSKAVKRRKSSFSLAVAASASAGMLVAQLAPKALAANDLTATVKNGSTDLTANASYNFSSGTTIGNTYDVVFANGTAYSPSAFTINANLALASLNDLTSTPLTIDDTSATVASTLTLAGATNIVAPFNADVIYVGSGANLSIGTASPTKPLTLALTGNVNFDNAGILNIGAAINISTGKALNIIGSGTTTITGAMSPATGTASLVMGGSGTLVDNVANSFAKMSTLTITGGGTVSTTANQADTTLPTAINIGAAGIYSELGSTSASTSNAYGVFTLNTGSGTVSINGNSGFTTVFSATKFNRSAGATGLIRGTNLGQGTTGDGQFTLGDSGASLGTLVGSSTINAGTVTGTATSLQIVPFLLGDSSATGSGSNFVAYDATNGFRVLGAGSQDVTLSAGYTTAASPDNAIGFNGTVTASGLTVNSLLFNTTGQTLAGSGGLAVNSGAIAVVGASPTSDTIDASFGSLTLGNGEGVLTATAGNTLTINTPISVTGSGTGGLTVAGGGTVILNGSNSYSGPTTINGGTLTVGNASAIPAGTTLVFANPSTLNLSTFSQTLGSLNASSNSVTASTINIGASNTLTVTNNLTVGIDLSPSTAAVNTNLTITGGTLSVTGNVIVGLAQNQTVSVGSNIATLDLTGLANASLGSLTGPTSGANVVEVGYGGQNSGILKLSNTSNTITALGLLVGDSNGASGIGPVNNTLILGNGTNVINVATLAIGSGVSGTNLGNVTNKASGLVEFASQAPGGAGTVTIANEIGAAGVTIDIAYRGNSPGSSVSEVGTLDLRGHSVSINNATVINVANEDNAGAGSSTGLLAFDTGTISATTINVGSLSAGSSTAASTGNINMGGGTLTVGTLNLGTKTGAGTGLATGIVNVTGGTLTVNSGFSLGSRATGGTVAATLSITGGTVSSSVPILQGTTASTTGTVTLNGGTLNLNGNALGGSVPITNLNFQSGTLENVSEINNGAAIAKTTSGTLTITGTNTYTGMTNVNAGTVIIGSSGAVTNSIVNLNGGAVNFASGLGSATFGGLAGSGNLALVDTATSPAPVALSVGNAASTTYSGNLTGAGSLTKNGAGLLTLSGTASTYGGATTINSGGILVAGNLSNTSVTVNSPGYLTGTGNGSSGIVGGNVTIGSGAAIDFSKDGAVSTAEKLTVGSLNLSSGSNLTYNLQSAGVSDTVAVLGNLALTAGNQATINLGGTFAPGTYTLLTYANQTGIAPTGLYTNGTANEPFTIGTTPFSGSIVYTFNDSNTALTLQVAVSTSPVDYYYGAYARSLGGTGTSGTFGGTNGTLTNFASSMAGTNDAGQVPGATADVIFSANQSGTGGTNLSGANISASLDTNYTINSLTVNSTPASTTIGGGGNLTLNAGIDSFYTNGGIGIQINPAAGPVNINTSGQVIVGGNQTWNNASGSLFNVSSGVAGAAGSGNVTSLTLTNSNSGNTSLSGAISDGGNGGQLALIISNTGAGTTILSGSNTFTGGTTINSGAVLLGSATALGSTTSALTFGQGSTGTLSLKGNSITLTDLTTNATTVGTPIIQSGSTTAGTDTLTISTANTDTYAGVLQNGGTRVLGLTMAGNGTLILAGLNTYSGPTTINSGTLQAGIAGNASGGALGVASAVTLANNAGTTLALNGFNTTIGSLTGGGTTGGNINLGNGILTVGTDNTSPAAYGGLISGTGGLTKVGTGNLTLTNNNTFTGGTIVNAGTLTLNGGGTNGSLTGTLTINAGGTVEVANYQSLGPNANTQPEVSSVIINGGVLDNAMVPNNTGNFFAGEFTSFNMTGGTVTSTGGDAYSFNSQTIFTNASATQAVITAPLVIRAATTLTINTAAGTAPGGDLLISGQINQTGISSLTKSGLGTLVLTNTNTWGALTNITAGQVIIGSSGSLPAYAPTAANPISANVNISAGALLTLANHGTGSTIVPSIGILSNSGTVDLKNNALIVSNVSAGTYATLSNEIKTAYAGGTWTGNTSTGASITSSLAAGDPTHLTAVGIATGLTSFESLTVPSNAVLLKYTYYGDATLDGQVNSADYTLVDTGFLSQGGSSPLTGWQNGDFNYDGVINGSDYTLIDNAFNTQGAQFLIQIANPTALIAGSGATSAVPEPTGLGLVGIAAAGLLRRRRRAFDCRW